MKKLQIIIFATIFLFATSSLSAQSQIVPSKVLWKAGKETVSLKVAHDKGIKKTKELSLELFFNNDILKKYTKEKLKFEFKWFHYYSRKKVFMDSYTVNYNDSKIPESSDFQISSSRGNITHGWWEVVVIAKHDNKVIEFNGQKKFQIWIN